MTTLTSINTTHLGRKEMLIHTRQHAHDRQPSAHGRALESTCSLQKLWLKSDIYLDRLQYHFYS